MRIASFIIVLNLTRVIFSSEGYSSESSVEDTLPGVEYLDIRSTTGTRKPQVVINVGIDHSIPGAKGAGSVYHSISQLATKVCYEKERWRHFIGRQIIEQNTTVKMIGCLKSQCMSNRVIFLI